MNNYFSLALLMVMLASANAARAMQQQVAHNNGVGVMATSSSSGVSGVAHAVAAGVIINVPVDTYAEEERKFSLWAQEDLQTGEEKKQQGAVLALQLAIRACVEGLERISGTSEQHVRARAMLEQHIEHAKQLLEKVQKTQAGILDAGQSKTRLKDEQARRCVIS